jgi:hypothetical protein
MIITKYVSFYSRMGMFFSLILLHCLFADEWKISEIYMLYGGLAILPFLLYIGWIVIRKKLEEKYVSEPTC